MLIFTFPAGTVGVRRVDESVVGALALVRIAEIIRMCATISAAAREPSINSTEALLLALGELVDEHLAVALQVRVDAPELAVLHYHDQLSFAHILSARSKQVYNIDVLPEMHHDLELGSQCLDIHVVSSFLHHLDGNGGGLFRVDDASRVRLVNHAESAGTQLFT